MKNCSKVLNELQSNYDELLHKFAAAENALDKVRRLLPFSMKISAGSFKMLILFSISYKDNCPTETKGTADVKALKFRRCALVPRRPLAVEIVRRLLPWRTRWTASSFSWT